jgi:hypothetical protein
VQPLPGDFMENNVSTEVGTRALPRNIFPCLLKTAFKDYVV